MHPDAHSVVSIQPSATRQLQIPFLALNEKDKGRRGWRSGSLQSLFDAGTKLGRPRQGNTSCSRNILIVRPASISAPRIDDREWIHSKVDWLVMMVGSP